MNNILNKLTGLTALLVIGALIATAALASQSAFAHGIIRNLQEGVPGAMPETNLEEAEAAVMDEFPGASIVRVRLHGDEEDFTWRIRVVTADEKLVEARVDAQTGSMTTVEADAQDFVVSAVSFDGARATVLGDFPEALIIRADLHNLDSAPFWRFRLITTDASLVEVRIDATSGEVLRTKELKEAALPSVNLEDAKAIALAEFPGATIDRADLKTEKDILVWRIRLTTADGEEARLEINAQTGDITRTEIKSLKPEVEDNSGRGHG